MSEFDADAAWVAWLRQSMDTSNERISVNCAVMKRIKNQLYPLYCTLLERRLRHRHGSTVASHRNGPLIVSGFLNEPSGISRAADLTLLGMTNAGFRPYVHNLRYVFNRGGARHGLPVSEPGGVWILHCNPTEAMKTLSSIDHRSWRDRYRIGYWAYELPRAPKSWADAAKYFDEIWTPSRFVAESVLQSGADVPVHVMPHPVALTPRPTGRATKSDKFTVLAMGDILSSATRKNIFGAIEIYRAAFPVDDGSHRLIVKTNSSSQDSAFENEMSGLLSGRDDIHWRTEGLNSEDTAKLIACSDLFLSPHRSEGFGLAIAEALHYGVPVLATGWSGNLEFMSGLPDMTIDYALIPVKDRSGVYDSHGQQWANPDKADATSKLLRMRRSPELRNQLASLGRESLERATRVWDASTISKRGFAEWIELPPGAAA